MKNRILTLLAASIILTSCFKKITKTCTCKNPWGQIVLQQTNETNDKKASKEFEDECRAKPNTYTSSGSNVATTSTTVPCEIN